MKIELTQEEKDVIKDRCIGYESVYEYFDSYEEEAKLYLYELVEFTNKLREKGVTDITRLQLCYNAEDNQFELEGRVYTDKNKEFENKCKEALDRKTQRYKEYLKMQKEFKDIPS